MTRVHQLFSRVEIELHKSCQEKQYHHKQSAKKKKAKEWWQHLAHKLMLRNRAKDWWTMNKPPSTSNATQSLTDRDIDCSAITQTCLNTEIRLKSTHAPPVRRGLRGQCGTFSRVNKIEHKHKALPVAYLDHSGISSVLSFTASSSSSFSADAAISRLTGG